MESGKKIEDAFVMNLRQKVKEMKELVLRKEYELLLSKSDRFWLDGISSRLDKKVKIMEMKN